MVATTIGRDVQRAQALDLLAAARGGTGSVAIVGGPEGIGKSRFLEAFRALACEGGAIAARATNYETVRAPFGPFADLVEALRPSCPDLVPTDLGARTLFERCFGLTTSVADFTGDRRRLFAVLADALARAAQRTPICLTIDDAQWADPETLEFVLFLAASIGRSRIVLVLGISDDADDEATNDFTIALERFEQTVRIALDPLEERAARELVAFTIPPGKSLADRTVDDICRLGEGNPLFLAELVHVALAHDGTLVLSRSAEHATRKRLKTFDPRHARTLEVAAALGHAFALDDLTTIANVSRADALAALRAARDAAFVVEDPSIAERFVFRHEIVRTVVYESMFAAERTSVHQAIAQIFEARDAPPELLADQWRRAGDPARAATFAERAGEAALASGAFASARDRFGDVIEATTTEARRAEIACKLAQACDALGDTSSAYAHLASALAYYRGIAADATVAELECALSDLAYRCGDAHAAIAAARRVLDAAAARPEDRFTAHVSLATYYAYHPDVARARAEIARADAFSQGRNVAQDLRLEWARALVAMESEPGDAWRVPAQESLAMAERYGDPCVLAFASINFAAMARECGRPDLARPALARAIAVADANGRRPTAAQARCEAIGQLYAVGRLDEALARIREVVALQVHAPLVRVLLATVALPVLVDLGLVDDYAMIADRSLIEVASAMDEAPRYAALAAAFAYVDAMAGRTDEARALVGLGLRSLVSTRYVATALSIFARLGTLEQTTAVRDLFATENERRTNRSYRALVDAICERATNDSTRGRSAARRAVEIARGDGALLIEAHACELAGNLKDAIACFERCGAIAHVRRLTRERGALTKREEEVARALAEGLSNRNIAERLVLSERTVENHVAAIFAKHGVKNRSEFLRATLRGTATRS